MLRMIIEGVGFDHRRETVVVLKDCEGRRLLPIWVDAMQARSIAWELEGIQAPRPGSHDLLLGCVRLAEAHITRVVINDLQESTFYATIDIDTPQGVKHIDARPSDALAVAVRAKCPVFVDGGALSALVDIDDEEKVEATEEDISAIADIADVLPGLLSSNGETHADEELERFKRLLDE